jgi:hypothetical protein
VSARVEAGRIVVTYLDGTTGDVRQATGPGTGGGWSYEVAYDAWSTAEEATSTAVAADTSGVFHTQRLGYGDYHKLTFRRKGSAGWSEYYVDTGLNGSSSIAAAMVSGSLHVWYEKRASDGGTVLAHAWTFRNPPSFFPAELDTRGGLVIDGWRREVLDGNGGTRGETTNNVAGNGSLSVATMGQYGAYPHVFYRDDTRAELRHGWWNGARWTFEPLDGDRRMANGRTDAETGFAPSAVNLNGALHVFYSDWNTGLRHAWFPGGGWGYEQLDGSPAAAGRCTGSTTDKVFGWTATTLVGTQIYSFSSTMSPTNYRAVLRLAEYR